MKVNSNLVKILPHAFQRTRPRLILILVAQYLPIVLITALVVPLSDNTNHK